MVRAVSARRTWHWRVAVAAAFLVIGAISVTLFAFTYGGLRWRNPASGLPSPAEAVSPPHEAVTSAPQNVNVVLISIDTLRADHLGCYGYGPPTSPNLDRWSREAVVFDLAFAQAPSTLPSHASIFTSMLPSHHGALYAVGRPLPDRVTTLAELLQESGYSTAAFFGAALLDSDFGFAQGFQEYDDEWIKTKGVPRPLAREINAKAFAWLGDSAPEPGPRSTCWAPISSTNSIAPWG